MQFVYIICWSWLWHIGDVTILMHMHHRVTVCWQTGLDFFFVTFQFILSYISSLSISSSAIAPVPLALAMSFFCSSTDILPFTLMSIHFFTQSPSFSSSHVHTISNNSCKNHNSYQFSQFFTSRSVFKGDTSHQSNHLNICSLKL